MGALGKTSAMLLGLGWAFERIAFACPLCDHGSRKNDGLLGTLGVFVVMFLGARAGSRIIERRRKQSVEPRASGETH